MIRIDNTNLTNYQCLEMCAGAGGQALGLHVAGFRHSALIEIEPAACRTLELNNQIHNLDWCEIIEGDLKDFSANEARKYRGVIDLVAGGVPCPPFSKAGKQLGSEDSRDLFPTALRIVEQIQPRAVMLENVPGLLELKFEDYRSSISSKLSEMGYIAHWALVQSSQFGVPQLRPRAILVALRPDIEKHFKWPEPLHKVITVGEALADLMGSNGWPDAEKWVNQANKIAPTLVGGSKKHGGPDLGPTRAKQQWKNLGVYAHRIGADDEIPDKTFRGVLRRDGTILEGFENMPLLTTRMTARLQGFPDDWRFHGTKTTIYRQIGNAFPPPVAYSIGSQIINALFKADNQV